MPIYSFRSTQAGAPVLSGTAGAMLTLLRTCLTTGFGASSVQSMAVTDGVATVSLSAGNPFAADGLIQVSGAAPAALNGTWRVTSVAGNSLTFPAPGVASGVATGVITVKVPGAGWAETFSDANVAAFQPSAVEASGCLLRIDDAATTTARLRGYESMSDVNTGVGPVPTESQLSGGAYWDKSGDASPAARPWMLWADHRGAHVAVDPQGTGGYSLYYAGDIASVKSGDAWCWMLTGNTAARAASTTAPEGCNGYAGRTARTGAWMVRHHTGILGAVQMQRVGQAQNGTASDAYSGTSNYSVLGAGANQANNGLALTRVELINQGQRGVIPGLYHARSDWAGSLTTGTVLDGTDDLIGRRLMAVRVAAPSGSAEPGVALIDLTGPWV